LPHRLRKPRLRRNRIPRHAVPGCIKLCQIESSAPDAAGSRLPKPDRSLCSVPVRAATAIIHDRHVQLRVWQPGLGCLMVDSQRTRKNMRKVCLDSLRVDGRGAGLGGKEKQQAGLS